MQQAVCFRRKNGKQRNPARPKTHPLENDLFFLLKTLPGHSRLQPHFKAIRPTCRVCNPQSSHAPSRRDRGGQNTCIDMPLAGVCRSALSREQWRKLVDDVLSCSRSLQNYRSWICEVEDQTGLGCELLLSLIHI